MVVSNNNYLFKLCLIITFTIALLFFSVIFSLHFMIQKSTESQCVLKLGNEILYDLDRGINSKSMAEKLIEAYARSNNKNTNLRFLKTSLESCGYASVFIDENGTEYAVCENGKLYQYKKICKD